MRTPGSRASSACGWRCSGGGFPGTNILKVLSNGDRKWRQASLSPHDEDVPVWQEGGVTGDLPPSQDWRAFRAHLVSLERNSSRSRYTDNNNNTNSSSSSHGLNSSAMPPLLWPSQSDPTHQRRSSSSSSSSRTHAPRDPTTTTRKTTSGNNLPPPNRPAHPSSQAAAAARLAAAKQGTDCWAHTLAGPEVGCVLVACEDRVDMGFFHRTVVLITAHDEVQGTVGLVLNTPTPLMVNQVSATAALPGFQAVFGRQRLHLGGPLRLDQVTLLHSFRGLTDTACVADGLYTGGVEGAMQLIQAGLASPSQFMLSLGVSSWAPGQLDQELQSGCWHCVAAAPELLLAHTQDRRQRINTMQTEPGEEAVGSSDGDGGGGPDLGKALDPAGGGGVQGSVRERLAPRRRPRGSQQRPATPRQVYAMSQPHCNGVPPLRPPPQHPAAGTAASLQDICLWQRLMHMAQLM